MATFLSSMQKWLFFDIEMKSKLSAHPENWSQLAIQKNVPEVVVAWYSTI